MSQNNNPSEIKNFFRFVPIFLVFGVLLFKGFYVGYIAHRKDSLWVTLTVLYNDIPIFALVSYLSLVGGIVTKYFLCILLEIFAYLACLWCVVDVCVISLFNTRVPVAEILVYSFEVQNIQSFYNIAFLFVSLVVLVIYSRRFQFKVRKAYFLSAFSFVLMFLPGVSVYPEISQYATRIFRGENRNRLFAAIPPRFSDEELTRLGVKGEEGYSAAPDLGESNIILLVVESMSSVDSQRTSGLQSMLPKLDEISKEGILFTNFFANQVCTEGGLVSLLNGIPPIEYPGNRLTMFRSFSEQESIVSAYKKNGYDAPFIASSTLKFRDKGDFLSSIGLYPVFGVDELPTMKKAPRFTFEAASDQVLYGEATKILIQKLRDKKKFLFTIETTSSHEPYIDPLGRANTRENVWDYTDHSISVFYQKLKDLGFFENGILIVTGDHRKREAITSQELEIYGDSAPARIPLVVVGKNIPHGVVDSRLFQQSDLLMMMDKVSKLDSELSPFVIHIGMHSPALIGNNPQILHVFSAKESLRTSFDIEMHGSQIHWIAKKPQLSEQIESSVLKMIARLQNIRDLNSKKVH